MAITRRGAAREATAERAAAQEAFRILRSNLAVTVAEGDNRCIVVTSALEHEGKSSTSVAVAQSLAAAGSRVVLVDLDLRAPVLHTLLEASADGGAADVLLGRRGLESCLQRVRSRAEDGGAALRLLTAGPPVPNPTELLALPSLGQLLQQLAADADVVLIDAPPVLAVADALVIGQHTAGAILVVEAGRTTVPTIKQAKETLAKGHVRLLGVVLNRFDPRFALGRLDRIGSYGTQGGGGAPVHRTGSRRWLVPALVVALALVVAGTGAGLVAAREDDGKVPRSRVSTTTASTTTASTATASTTTTSAPPRSTVPDGEAWDGAARLFDGDQVLTYEGGAGTLELRHAGNGRFRARAYTEDGTSLELADESGPFVGRFPIRRGPVTVAVGTTGGWGAVVSAAPVRR